MVPTESWKCTSSSSPALASRKAIVAWITICSICSMYRIFSYIPAISGVNVQHHGAFGYNLSFSKEKCNPIRKNVFGLEFLLVGDGGFMIINITLLYHVGHWHHMNPNDKFSNTNSVATIKKIFNERHRVIHTAVSCKIMANNVYNCMNSS